MNTLRETINLLGRKELSLALIISAVYVGVGTYDLLAFKMPVSKWLDSISDGLNFTLLNPSQAGGIMFGWILGSIFGAVLFWQILGQTITHIFIFAIVYLLIKVIVSIKYALARGSAS